MKQFLKYGGLALSACLTISLFIRLFGQGPYGIIMAFAALALFEGGALAWSHLLENAKFKQRGIVQFALWFCILASVLSSGAEIILATHLWTPLFDINFVTLMVIVLSLATNVMGIFAYEQMDADKARRNRELDMQAKQRMAAEKLEWQIMDQSITKAESRVNEIAGSVSDSLATELKTDVVNYLLSQTRNGRNTVPALPIGTSHPPVQIEAPAEPDVAEPLGSSGRNIASPPLARPLARPSARGNVGAGVPVGVPTSNKPFSQNGREKRTADFPLETESVKRAE